MIEHQKKNFIEIWSVKNVLCVLMNDESKVLFCWFFSSSWVCVPTTHTAKVVFEHIYLNLFTFLISYVAVLLEIVCIIERGTIFASISRRGFENKNISILR